MNRKYNTDEERKEAKRLRDKIWRQNRTQEQIDKKNASERKRISNMNPKQLQERRESQKRYNDKIKGIYVTYKHTNEKGDVYYGSGTIQRAKAVSKSTRRNGNHYNAFKGSPNIEILATFKNLEIARAYESYLIAQEGLENLVNRSLPVFKLTFPQR